jgi:hypothetical protein
MIVTTAMDQCFHGTHAARRHDVRFHPRLRLITLAVAGRNLGLASSQHSEESRPPAPVLYAGPHADRVIKGWASSPRLYATHDAHLNGIRDDR